MATISITNTFGESYIGVVLAAVLYGITVLQTLQYFDSYRDDRLQTKLLVFGVWMLDTMHLIFLIHGTWYYLVENYANPIALAGIVWTLTMQVIFTALLAFIVQCFFAHRVWSLSKKWYLSLPIVAFSLAHVVFDLYFVIGLLKNRFFVDFPRFTWATTASLASSIVSDILICGSLCFYLWSNRTGFSKTDSLINSLITISINTGLLTTICSFITMMLFALSTTTFLSQTFYAMLSKFYVNSFLATLNSRKRLAQKSGEVNSYQLSGLAHQTNVRFHPVRAPTVMSMPQQNKALNIVISHETYLTDDPNLNSGKSDKSLSGRTLNPRESLDLDKSFMDKLEEESQV